eukprot:TRINITY_DN73236_c0_g1_i1.p2 TRINITY_DN73236_c0_g1~~TRINITY_DN73236_c0_g1_i1.p2  ORF type:complete len:124 (-),score=12.50 TRINITY_DN73236_c0_g1_i1:384-710(-)
MRTLMVLMCWASHILRSAAQPGDIPKIHAPRCPLEFSCPEPCWEDRAMDCASRALRKERHVFCCVICCHTDDCYSEGRTRYNAAMCCAEANTTAATCGLHRDNSYVAV